MIGPDTSLLNRVRRVLNDDLAVPLGEPLLVACSGGADSVALAFVLAALGHPVRIAHLDHGARPGSAEDAVAVEALSAREGWLCRAARIEVPPGGAFEERARAVRLEFLAAAARSWGLRYVALGHHRDDQAETVLFRLMRGAGPDGLTGIPGAREAWPGITLIRPLLGERRETLRAWLRESGRSWLEDPTNADLRPARNLIRHEILPRLRQLHPAADENVVLAASLLRDGQAEESARAEAWLGHHAQTVAPGLLEFERSAFLAASPQAQGELLRTMARRAGRPVPGLRGAERMRVLVASGRAGAVEGGWEVIHHEGVVVFRNAPTWPAPQPFLCWGWQATEAWGWRIGVHPAREALQGPGFCLGPDVDRWGWRSARPSTDQFTPLGSARSRPLGGWLTRRGVPGHRQAARLVLADGDRVLWVVGLGWGQEALASQEGERVQMQVTACFQV